MAKFLAPPYYSQRAVFASPLSAFSLLMLLTDNCRVSNVSSSVVWSTGLSHVNSRESSFSQACLLMNAVTHNCPGNDLLLSCNNCEKMYDSFLFHFYYDITNVNLTPLLVLIK